MRSLMTIAALCFGTPLISQNMMELHLVLAFDVSASVNDVEFDLQRSGTADALRDPAVMSAIGEAPGGMAISIVQWSSIKRQALGLDWVVLDTVEDAASYADKVDAMPRRLPGGGTMIHAGLEFAAQQLDTAPGQARRRVIDLSGNGRTDDDENLAEMRDKLISVGVVINALAIEELNNDLTTYFYSYVIGGPQAFVATADDFEDFTDAMQIKLLREISGAMFSNADDKTRETQVAHSRHFSSQPRKTRN